MPAQRGNTRVASGSLGTNQAVGTDVCVINDIGKGSWEVSGTTRHSFPDGVRLAVGPVDAPFIIATLPNSGGATEVFGPIVFDVIDGTHDVVLELAEATGNSGSASGVIYARRVTPL